MLIKLRADDSYDQLPAETRLTIAGNSSSFNVPRPPASAIQKELRVRSTTAQVDVQHLHRFRRRGLKKISIYRLAST